MLLYATVQSERATKGQGGNDYLQIDVMAGDARKQRKIASLLVSVDGDTVNVFNEFTLKQVSLSEIAKGETKGEKQKDKYYNCTHTIEGSTCSKHGGCIYCECECASDL
jgi:hypothetical protein